MAWQTPSLTVKWGSYFGKDPAEEKATVEFVTAALAGKAITKRMAIEKLAPIFGIENIEAALTELEEEQAKAADEEAKRAQDELAHAHALANGDNSNQAPNGPGAGAGGNAPKAPNGGSRGGPAAKPKA